MLTIHFSSFTEMIQVPFSDLMEGTAVLGNVITQLQPRYPMDANRIFFVPSSEYNNLHAR